MRFLKPDEIDYSKFSDTRELTPEEKSEVIRLYEAELDPAELEQYADLTSATPMEDLLRELEERQRRWDEQHG